MTFLGPLLSRKKIFSIPGIASRPCCGRFRFVAQDRNRIWAAILHIYNKLTKPDHHGWAGNTLPDHLSHY